MGQYYTLTCPETGTYVSASALGSFVKAYEQVYSMSQPAALAYLTSAGRGNHPRDLPWAPTGLWAGRMPLMAGDYAENGDLVGREKRIGMDEEHLYGSISKNQVRLDSKPVRRKYSKDLSSAIIPVIERTHGVRCSDLQQDGSIGFKPRFGLRDFYPVRKTDDGWQLDTSEVNPKDRQQVLEYYERLGAFKNTAWQRESLSINPETSFTPLQDAPDSIPGADEGKGGRMIWVNLDRREFVDPEVIGDTPDLVGVMQGDSARAVLAMIVHRDRRGGGDLGDLGPIAVAGRWRGDRIVLLGPEGFRPPQGPRIAQADILSSYEDVSGNAHAFIRCVEYFGAETFQEVNSTRSDATSQEKEIISLTLQALPDTANPQEVVFEITPATTIEKSVGGQEEIKAPIRLAPTVDLYVDGGKLFIPAGIRKEINKIAEKLPETTLSLSLKSEGRRHLISYDCSITLNRQIQSQHDIIWAHQKAA